jgi:hypothetical protein
LVYMDSLDSANRRKNVVSLNDPETMKKIQENTQDIRSHLSVGNMTAMYAYLNVKISSAEHIFDQETLHPSPGSSRSSYQVDLPQRVIASPNTKGNERVERKSCQFVEFLLDEDRGMTLLKLLHHIFVGKGRNDMKIVIFSERSQISNLAEYIRRTIESSSDRAMFPTILAITGLENYETYIQIMSTFRSQNKQLLIVFDEFFENQRSGG